MSNNRNNNNNYLHFWLGFDKIEELAVASTTEIIRDANGSNRWREEWARHKRKNEQSGLRASQNAGWEWVRRLKSRRERRKHRETERPLFASADRSFKSMKSKTKVGQIVAWATKNAQNIKKQLDTDRFRRRSWQWQWLLFEGKSIFFFFPPTRTAAVLIWISPCVSITFIFDCLGSRSIVTCAGYTT